MPDIEPITATPLRLWCFTRRVMAAFRDNRGLLMAGGVGYNTLLSMIPLFALTVVGFSMVYDERLILETISGELLRLIPGQSREIVAAVAGIIEARDYIGVIGFAVLIFFSTMAFRMLEDAMAVIFRGPRRSSRLRRVRAWWLSALLPYGYVGLLVLALIAITLVRGALQGMDQQVFSLSSWQISIEQFSNLTFDLFTFGGLVVLFVSIYRVMPPVRVAFRRALVGGITAAVLWQVTFRFLLYYFAQISLVNVIYGSLAAVIIVLISMEIGAIILLLGAQVIAELEHSSAAGVGWWESPE